jgi:hydroxyacylglutathione hydrolase
MMKTWKTKSGCEIIQLLTGRSNVFLLTHAGVNILVDTSVPRAWRKLQKRLQKAGADHLDYLILTHAHFDHAGNAKRIKEKFHAQVLIQKEEAAYLAQGDNIIPWGTTWITHPLMKLLGRRLFPLFRYQPCAYDIVVDSRFDLNTFGISGYLLHTPGHTKGSMSVVVDDEVALAGDTLFGVVRGSVFPPYAEDVPEMIRSWGKLLQTGCSVFIPSHGTANTRITLQRNYNKRS